MSGARRSGGGEGGGRVTGNQALDISAMSQLADDAVLFGVVDAMFMAAVAAGDITDHRQPPTGEEAVVWCGPADAPLGFATFFPVSEARLWLDVLYVAPDWRRQGIGRALISAVAKVGRERLGCHRIEFGTLLRNVAMQALAADAGFSLEGLFYARGAGGGVE